jgi:glycyl-tRNA synthetase (class II)
MDSKADSQRMEKIVSLCKRRGFIFQSSEIYGGLNGAWDYGPLGVELKRNLKNYWWRVMVHERDDVVGMDGSILMNRAVWKASRHEDTFSDPMVDCLVSGKRFRADQIDEQSGWVVSCGGATDFDALQKLQQEQEAPERSRIWSDIELGPHLRRIFVNYSASLDLNSRSGYVQLNDPIEQMKSLGLLINRGIFGSSSLQPFVAMEIGGDPKSFRWSSNRGVNRAIKLSQDFYRKRGVTNPIVFVIGLEREEHSKRFNPETGSLLTEPRPFNLMFKTYVGATEDESSITYLRPETAQSIFVQFKNVLEVSRKKLPFGIAQIGKAFRNEINPRNFTFRSREFEQMELEYFCRPEQGMELLEYWKEERLTFYEQIGIPRSKLHVLTVPDKERAFYSKGTYDIEYDFPFGRQELEGVAYRTDYDLSQHQNASGKSLEYFDEETKQRFVPHVVEPSAGVDRTVLALICEAYSEDEAPDEKGKMERRLVLRFHPRMAPIKCGVFPLLRNNAQLVTKAKEIVDLLRPHMNIFYDESGAIGRRYRRQDEIGTPFGVTVDFETLGEKDAALRDTVTLRERDSMKQERVPINDLAGMLMLRIS